MYGAAGNHVIADVMRVQFGHLRRAVHTILSATGYPRKAWDEHARILDAVVDHVPNRARARARAHIKDARALLAKKFAPTEGEQADKSKRRHQIVWTT